MYLSASLMAASGFTLTVSCLSVVTSCLLMAASHQLSSYGGQPPAVFLWRPATSCLLMAASHQLSCLLMAASHQLKESQGKTPWTTVTG
jgi:hypothetical protein